MEILPPLIGGSGCKVKSKMKTEGVGDPLCPGLLGAIGMLVMSPCMCEIRVGRGEGK